MQHVDLQKWDDIVATEGLLFFAQSVCELLDDHTLDTYKVPALNLHLNLLELLKLVSLFNDGRIKKGTLSFSVDELTHRIKEDVIFDIAVKKLLSLSIKQIGEILKCNEENVDVNKLSSTCSAMLAIVQNNFRDSINRRLPEAISKSSEKKAILAIAMEFVTELGLEGFSREYVLSKTKKFFFSPKSLPERINSNDQIVNFIDIFNAKRKKWNVIFKGDLLPQEVQGYANLFEIRCLSRVPAKYKSISKFQKYTDENKNKKKFYMISGVPAKEPHRARKIAEQLIEDYIDVCRFHNHNLAFQLCDKAFVHNTDDDQYYIISKPLKPMECGATFRKAESADEMRATFDILSGSHFLARSRDDFRKVLDFHHAATESENHENQLLDLWAAIEGFLPVHDGKCDRVVWYSRFITPALTLSYNDKIFRKISDEFATENEQIINYIDSVPINTAQVNKTICLLTCEEFKPMLDGLYKLLDHNPLLRYRAFTLSEAYSTTRHMHRVLDQHKKRLEWHISRIYTLRNHIAHNASSLPYIRSLVENLHDYLDTLIISVSTLGRKIKRKIQIGTTLEMLSIIEQDYLASLSSDRNITADNCFRTIFGANNILSNFYKC